MGGGRNDAACFYKQEKTNYGKQSCENLSRHTQTKTETEDMNMNKQYDPIDFDRIGDWTIAQLVKEEHEKKKSEQDGGTDTP